MSGQGMGETRREREIFERMLDCESDPEREAILARECGEDQELRAAVEVLWKAHGDDGFMRTPAGGGTHRKRGAEDWMEGLEGPGHRIGPYRLGRVVGQGGGGTVYEAEQEEPVRRRVALKILRPGMDTRSVIARFEAERQALAWMDHPNIARVLDAGATSGGRPYFVMEFIEGVRITEHVERGGLGLEERLRLFLQVCKGVQHAHQRGIIHRDLKPSNVLVGMVDGVAVPKVIDFGIAKVLAPGGTGLEAETSSVTLLGTPYAMSPEQAEGGGSKVDTRTDVYGLGVVLYAMLAGRPPFDPERLAAAGFEGLRRILREETPPLPSRVGVGREGLRGDLDWIVMKCLEKAPARRYETVNELATDIRRHLEREPVLARPPSLAYVMTKFVSRHRMAVLAVASGMVVLLAGLGVAVWVGVEQRRFAEAAEEARREQERLRLLAEGAADTAQQQSYAADILLAEASVQGRVFGRARALLDRHVPGPGEKDRRGWEWGYLRQACRSEAWYTVGRWPGGVAALEASSDGKWVAMGGREGGLWLWDSENRREMERWETGEGAPIFAVSPDGKGLGFVVRDQERARSAEKVRWWDVSARRSVFEHSMSNRVQVLAMDPEGKSLLAILGDGEWVRWGMPEGRVLEGGRLPGVGASATYSVRGDLEVVAVGGSEGTLRAVELRTGRALWTRRVAREEAPRSLFSTDGRLVVALGLVLGGARWFEAESGRPAGMAPGGGEQSSVLRFSPEGERVARAGADQAVTVSNLGSQPVLRLMRGGGLDPSGLESAQRQAARRSGMAAESGGRDLGRLTIEYRGHEREVLALAWMPDHRTLLSGDREGVVLAWDTQQVPVDPAAPRYLPDGARGWAFDKDGGRSVVTVDGVGVVRRWRWAEEPAGEPLFEVPLGDGVVKVAPGGARLATGGTNGVVEVWDIERRRRWLSLAAGVGRVEPLAFTAGAERLVTRDEEGRLREWELAGGREWRHWNSQGRGHGREPAAAAISSDGRWYLEVEEGGAAVLRDGEQGTERVWDLGLRGVRQVVWNRAATIWVGLTRGGDAVVWDRETGRQLALLQGFRRGARAAAFSEDGRRLALAGEHLEAVKIYETESFRELVTLRFSGFAVDTVAFSRDGLSLVIGSYSGRMIFWRNGEDGGGEGNPAPEGVR